MNTQFPVSKELGLQPVKKFMNRKVISITSTTSIATAIHIMQAHAISGLAVVNAQEVMVGCYSEWDAMLQGSSHALTDVIKFHTPVISVLEDAPFRKVVALMIKNKIKRIFVTNSEQQPVGLLSRSDVLKLLFEDYKKQNHEKN